MCLKKVGGSPMTPSGISEGSGRPSGGSGPVTRDGGVIIKRDGGYLKPVGPELSRKTNQEKGS
jgi:hypothetical protein